MIRNIEKKEREKMSNEIDVEGKIYTVGNEFFDYVEKHPDEIIDFLLKKRMIQMRKIYKLKNEQYFEINIDFRYFNLE